MWNNAEIQAHAGKKMKTQIKNNTKKTKKELRNTDSRPSLATSENVCVGV